MDDYLLRHRDAGDRERCVWTTLVPAPLSWLEPALRGRQAFPPHSRPSRLLHCSAQISASALSVYP